MLIALGVTGGIGAYKAVEVARGLQKRGHDVVAIMTHSATKFVGPVTFEAITRRARDHRSVRARRQFGHRAHRAGVVDRSAAHRAGDGQHHRQARQRHRRRFPVHDVHRDARADAAGSGDEHATCSRTRPCERISTRSLRAAFASSSRAKAISPAAGSGKDGWPSPTKSSQPRKRCCGRKERCAGSASSSRPVRRTKTSTRCAIIGNRSSGRMGFAIAAEAARRGAVVTLVAGPTSIEPPAVGEVVRVRGAAEMHREVLARADRADVVVMAAAVADYAPADRAAQKIAKGDDTITLVLKKTPDILADLGRERASHRASGRCSSDLPRRRTTSSLARPRSGIAKQRRSDRRQRRVARRRGLRRRHQCRHDHRPATARRPCRCRSKARVAAEILDRVEKLLAVRTPSVRL